MVSKLETYKNRTAEIPGDQPTETNDVTGLSLL